MSLLPYWVNVLASYPGNNAAAGMFVLWLGVFGGLLVAQVQLPDVVVFGWLLLLVVGGRSWVRLWSARHRRRVVDG